MYGLPLQYEEKWKEKQKYLGKETRDGLIK
jgi:hypothetical protein